MSTMLQTATPRLTPADLVRPSSYAETQQAHEARLAAIHAACAATCEEAERDKTRATAARQKALSVANAEHTAEAARRQDAAVRFAIRLISPRAEHFIAQRNHTTASEVARVFRLADEHMMYAANRRLGRELGVVFGTAFIARVPEAIEVLGQYDVWHGQSASSDSLPYLVNATNVAMRDEHNLTAHLDALVRFESAIGKCATAVFGGRLLPEEAPKHWAILQACNAVTEGAALKALADEQKAKGAAASEAERMLKLAAVRGDEAARAELNKRGVLGAVLAHGASILRMALGHDNEKPAP